MPTRESKMEGKNSLKLRRVITLPRATALVVGTIIGASIFVQPFNVTSLIPSVSGIIFLWLASGLLTLNWAEELMRLVPAGK